MTVKQIDKEIKQLETQLETIEGTDTEVYTRIVGYYRPVSKFNPGRAEEYKHRKLFSLTKHNR
jgi:ribonucleoside-triphosphate reductase